MKSNFLLGFLCSVFIAQLSAAKNNIVKNFSGLSQYNSIKNSNSPKILRILTATKFGGIETQTVKAYKYFLEKGYDINLLVTDNSGIKRRLAEEKLPFSSIKNKKTLEMALLRNYQKMHLDIIHCHKGNEYSVVKNFSKKVGISCIAHYHSHELPNPNTFKDFDAFVASSPKVFNFMREANRIHNLVIKYIEFIHPPHEENKFLNFKPRVSKVDFFKSNFNIQVDKRPVILMIANLFKYKNHALLLKAIFNLIHEHRISAELVLAGDNGDIQKATLERLAENLKISKHVHFLGFTELIPELLYYSDINVLCSIKEAFGIVLMEAALMKKPIILSRSADLAGLLIEHEKTGLLCNPRDPLDLAIQIKRLIQDSAFAKQLGKNVYNLVINNFSNKSCLDKFEKLYRDLYLDRKRELTRGKP